MEDATARLMEALDLLAEVADDVPAHVAVSAFDDATLQMFWREWPRTSAWAGMLWRLLDADLAAAASPADEFDEIGGSG